MSVAFSPFPASDLSFWLSVFHPPFTPLIFSVVFHLLSLQAKRTQLLSVCLSDFSALWLEKFWSSQESLRGWLQRSLTSPHRHREQRAGLPGNRPGWTGFRSLITTRKLKKGNNCFKHLTKGNLTSQVCKFVVRADYKGEPVLPSLCLICKPEPPPPHMHNWTLTVSASMWPMH